jgi:hypothetical protein
LWFVDSWGAALVSAVVSAAFYCGAWMFFDRVRMAQLTAKSRRPWLLPFVAGVLGLPYWAVFGYAMYVMFTFVRPASGG